MTAPGAIISVPPTFVKSHLPLLYSALPRTVAFDKLRNHARILVIIVLASAGLHAQEAVIHGKVTDEQGAPLEAASVYAIGAVVGAFTDADGEFELDVASGRVRLVVSYIGFENFDTTLMVAVADRKIDLDIVLTETFSDLGEVIVTGRRATGQAQALRLMQSAQSAQTIIHSETFNKYPDVTLAETVARMPGVSIIRDVSQGQLVQLRGLPEQYTGVSLNGQRLPNIQPEDDQSGALSIIQSNLVEEVRIIKSRTAETDGDVIAGIVNFQVRQPEDQFEVLAQAAGGLNFGFDGNPDQYNGITQLVGTVNSEVSEEKVYFLASGSYLSEGRGVRTQQVEYGPNRSRFAARPHDENILTERVGFVGAVELRPSPLNRMRLSLNQSTNRQTYERRQLSANEEEAFRIGTAWETDRRISLVALEVENNFPKTRLDYQLSFSENKERLDGRRRAVYRADRAFGTGTDFSSLTPYSSAGGTSSLVGTGQQDAELEETVAIGSLNITRWLNPKRTQSLKAGARYRSKDRAYGLTTIDFAVSDGDPVADGTVPLLEERPEPNFADPGSEEARIYDAKQRIAAGYLMYSANLNARFSLNAGLRYEYLEVEARDFQDTIAFDESDLLPSVNFTYRFRRDRQMRLSAYRALGRPSYANYRPETEPIALIPVEQYALSNPELQSTNSSNIDLTFERYGRRDGLISLGLYAKFIDRPTLRQTIYNNSLDNPRYITQIVNSDDARIFGFEAGVYQSLGALRRELRFFNVNATYNFNTIDVNNPGRVSDELPLAQAPRQSANLSLVYSNPTRGVNVVLATNFRDRFFDRTLNEDPVWRNNLFSLDLAADYEIFRNVSLLARVNNLTDHPFEEWLGRPSEDGAVLRSRSRYGTWGLVGVRFRP